MGPFQEHSDRTDLISEGNDQPSRIQCGRLAAGSRGGRFVRAPLVSHDRQGVRSSAASRRRGESCLFHARRERALFRERRWDGSALGHCHWREPTSVSDRQSGSSPGLASGRNVAGGRLPQRSRSSLESEDRSALELRHGRAISHVDFAAGGQVLVTASEDRTARFWDVQSGEPAASTVVHERPLVWAEITADRRRVMTAGLDGAIRSWELDTHFDAECRLKPTGPLSSVQLSPDEQSLLLTQREGPAILCRLRGPELVATSLGRSVADCGAFSPDGRVLVTANNQGLLELFDSAGKRLGELKDRVGTTSQISVSPNGELLVACGSDGIARVVLLSGGKPPLTLTHGAGLKRAFFSDNGQEIYTVSDRSICVWDPGSGARRSILQDFTEIKDCHLRRISTLL